MSNPNLDCAALGCDTYELISGLAPEGERAAAILPSGYLLRRDPMRGHGAVAAQSGIPVGGADG